MEKICPGCIIGAKTVVVSFLGGIGGSFVGHEGFVGDSIGVGLLGRLFGLLTVTLGGRERVIEIPLSLEVDVVFGGGNDCDNGLSSEDVSWLEGLLGVVKFGAVDLGDARTSPNTKEAFALGEAARGGGFVPCWNVVTRLAGSKGRGFELVRV